MGREGAGNCNVSLFLFAAQLISRENVKCNYDVDMHEFEYVQMLWSAEFSYVMMHEGTLVGKATIEQLNFNFHIRHQN